MIRRLTEEQIQDLIRKIEFEPLEINVAKRPAQSAADLSGGGADVLLDVRWKKNSQKFIAEILRQATPKQVETGLLRLENQARTKDGQNGRKCFYPMLIAPYLNERNLQRLAKAEISGIDLSGNGIIIIPDELFVYRTGGKNKFLSSAPIKNVFRGTSSLVARVFFARPEYANVGEVLEEITRRGGETTFSTVSKVLKALEEELIVGKGERIRLLDAKRLLDLLLKNYRPPDVRRRLSVKCADYDAALKKMSENAERKKILYAWDYPGRYAPLVQGAAESNFYTQSINELLDGVDFTETNRFSNMTFLETDEPTIYFDRRKDKEFDLLSPLQTFLQLSNEGKREQEAAKSMIRKLIEGEF